LEAGLGRRRNDVHRPDPPQLQPGQGSTDQSRPTLRHQEQELGAPATADRPEGSRQSPLAAAPTIPRHPAGLPDTSELLALPGDPGIAGGRGSAQGRAEASGKQIRRNVMTPKTPSPFWLAMLVAAAALFLVFSWAVVPLVTRENRLKKDLKRASGELEAARQGT